MNFDLLAKQLIQPNSAGPKINSEGPLERANALQQLANAGFGQKDIFSELRALYDGAEDDILKKQILDIVIKVHGLYKDDDKKEAPTIIFNFNGDKARMENMLCPSFAPCEI